MLRPITMGNVNFGIKRLDAPDTKDTKNTESTEEKFHTGLTHGEKNSLIAGMFIGALMATTGSYMYNNAQNKEMIKIMQEELSYDKGQTLKIEDATNDKRPDIVLEDSAGHKTIFDFAEHNIYLNDGDGLMEYLK